MYCYLEFNLRDHKSVILTSVSNISITCAAFTEKKSVSDALVLSRFYYERDLRHSQSYKLRVYVTTRF